MKIWLFTTNLQGGGAERSMINIASGLHDRGHEVKLVLFERRIAYDLPKSLSVELVQPSSKGLTRGWPGKQILKWRLRRWIHRHLDGGYPDLMLSTLPFSDEIVRECGLRDVWYRIPNPLLPQISGLTEISQRKARRRLARFQRLYSGQNLVAISQGIADELHGKLGIAEARIATIYNPFDFDAIARLAALPEPKLPDEPYILHAARFVPQKRHDLVLDAFAASKLPHRLVLLTRKSEALSGMIAARGLGERVTIAGFQRNPFPWYAKASALVHASDFEGFGNVLVEALACGTPVVSTDCPFGPREILTGSLARYLSPCGDAAALARNLVDCVASPPVIDPAALARFRKDVALDAIEALAGRQALQSRNAEKRA